MVHPIEEIFILPPNCDEYSTGSNAGKCEGPLSSSISYNCGEIGVIPEEYIGVREVCLSQDGPCDLGGPNGTGIPNTDYLLFVSANDTGTYM